MKTLLFLVAVGCTGSVTGGQTDACGPAEFELTQRASLAPLESSGARLDCGTGRIVDTECEYGPGVRPIAEGFDPSYDSVWMCVGRLTDGHEQGWVIARVWCET